MKRYIDAEDVEKRIDIVMGSEPKAWDKKALKELKMYVVHAVPTADVRENVRGEWLDYWDNPIKFYFDGRYSAHCSVCGYHPEYEEEMRSANFCPNCGAEMRGKEE